MHFSNISKVYQVSYSKYTLYTGIMQFSDTSAKWMMKNKNF